MITKQQILEQYEKVESGFGDCVNIYRDGKCIASLVVTPEIEAVLAALNVKKKPDEFDALLLKHGFSLATFEKARPGGGGAMLRVSRGGSLYSILGGRPSEPIVVNVTLAKLDRILTELYS